MAMTITNMVNFATLKSSCVSNSVTSSNPVAKTLSAASLSDANQIGSTKVLLSAFGQIKSGFSALQMTGNALATLASNVSTSFVSKAVQNFVSAYNTTATALGTALKGNGMSAGVLAKDTRAYVANNDLWRVLPGSINSADLQKIGFSVGKNGLLSVDTKILEKALQEDTDSARKTLTKLGQQANSMVSQELSSAGAVGSAVNSLNVQVLSQTTSPPLEAGIVALAQSAIQQNGEQMANSGSAIPGISAYMKIFSM